MLDLVARKVKNAGFFGNVFSKRAEALPGNVAVGLTVNSAPSERTVVPFVVIENGGSRKRPGVRAW
ncbi:hypothetical protein [Spirosoma montaniterrae]|uniref:hypothetical protein n=1 Tax=Spirosoma montaniterrae TaxID=1178516 RepID=UPI001E5E29C8|nr:hypothetical protein [Spirosoma montaniterrae]